MQDLPNQHLNLTAADLFPDKKVDMTAPAAPPVVASPVEASPETSKVAPPVSPVVATPRKSPLLRSVAANVLHVRVVTGCGGGPEKTILRSPRNADQSRYNMAAAYLYPEADPGMCVIRDNARYLGCPLYEVAERYALDHHTVGALIELCRELKIDIWHSHDYKSNLMGLLVKRFHKMKLVTTAHGFTRETWRTRLYYHLDNLAMLGYDQVIAVSPPLIKHCASHGVNPDRLTYIPNAIDISEYKRTQSKAQAKAQLGLSPDRFAIGVIGRLSPEKGVDRAIRMMPELLAKHPEAELHLIGDGQERGKLESLASKLGIGDAIHWWGWQNDARPFYEVLDSLLLPSRTEGLPNVVLEAMAMGVPVAATNVGGISDLLDAGECGQILSDNEGAWAHQIGPLLSKPGIGEAYTNRAFNRVHSDFGFSRRMSLVMSVYDRVLGRNSQSSMNHHGVQHAARKAA